MELKSDIEPLIKQTTSALLKYCQQDNWSGYDPYDALNSEIFKRLPFLNSRLPRLALTQILKRSPLNLRKLLLIPKTQNPKALALFLMAFVKLDKMGLLANADIIPLTVQNLINLRSGSSLKPVNRHPLPVELETVHRYYCWGYSFPWQGRKVLAPKGAPNLVCTVFVANALLDAYEANRDAENLRMATSAADYILNELYWTKGDSVAGFSYPVPALQVQVHNANFLGAALFCRIYKYCREERFLEPAMKAARCSAAQQQADGSWDYGELSTQRWIDNFHTGFNLCALQTINQCLNTNEFEPNIRSGFEFYRNNFFRDDGAPQYFHNRVYPIDIHSVAQSIITLMEFKDLSPGNIELAQRVFEWAKENMWDERGYFYYQVTPYYKNKIPYMRWSQAWMLLALASLMETKNIQC